MTYALLITIAAALALVALVGGGALLARRAAGTASRGEAPFGSWRWYPSPLGLALLVLLPLAGLLLWRAFPVFLFLPVVLPFFWRWRGRAFGRGSRGHERHDGRGGRPDEE